MNGAAGSRRDRQARQPIREAINDPITPIIVVGVGGWEAIFVLCNFRSVQLCTDCWATSDKTTQSHNCKNNNNHNEITGNHLSHPSKGYEMWNRMQYKRFNNTIMLHHVAQNKLDTNCDIHRAEDRRLMSLGSRTK